MVRELAPNQARTRPNVNVIYLLPEAPRSAQTPFTLHKRLGLTDAFTSSRLSGSTGASSLVF